MESHRNEPLQSNSAQQDLLFNILCLLLLFSDVVVVAWKEENHSTTQCKRMDCFLPSSRYPSGTDTYNHCYGQMDTSTVRVL